MFGDNESESPRMASPWSTRALSSSLTSSITTSPSLSVPFPSPSSSPLASGLGSCSPLGSSAFSDKASVGRIAIGGSSLRNEYFKLSRHERRKSSPSEEDGHEDARHRLRSDSIDSYASWSDADAVSDAGFDTVGGFSLDGLEAGFGVVDSIASPKMLASDRIRHDRHRGLAAERDRADQSDFGGHHHRLSVARQRRSSEQGLSPEVDRAGNLEYKLKLLPSTQERFNRLVTQLKWRLTEGGGVAIYEIGVLDDGTLMGLSPADMCQSLCQLARMAREIGATVEVRRVIQVRRETIDEVAKAPASNIKAPTDMAAPTVAARSKDERDPDAGIMRVTASSRVLGPVHISPDTTTELISLSDAEARSLLFDASTSPASAAPFSIHLGLPTPCEADRSDPLIQQTDGEDVSIFSRYLASRESTHTDDGLSDSQPHPSSDDELGNFGMDISMDVGIYSPPDTAASAGDTPVSVSLSMSTAFDPSRSGVTTRVSHGFTSPSAPTPDLGLSPVLTPTPTPSPTPDARLSSVYVPAHVLASDVAALTVSASTRKSVPIPDGDLGDEWSEEASGSVFGEYFDGFDWEGYMAFTLGSSGRDGVEGKMGRRSRRKGKGANRKSTSGLGTAMGATFAPGLPSGEQGNREESSFTGFQRRSLDGDDAKDDGHGRLAPGRRQGSDSDSVRLSRRAASRRRRRDAQRGLREQMEAQEREKAHLALHAYFRHPTSLDAGTRAPAADEADRFPRTVAHTSDKLSASTLSDEVAEAARRALEDAKEAKERKKREKEVRKRLKLAMELDGYLGRQVRGTTGRESQAVEAGTDTGSDGQIPFPSRQPVRLIVEAFVMRDLAGEETFLDFGRLDEGSR